MRFSSEETFEEHVQYSVVWVVATVTTRTAAFTYDSSGSTAHYAATRAERHLLPETELCRRKDEHIDSSRS